MHKHTLFITGAAGYVGAMLVQQYAAREDVAAIIALDKEPVPDFFAGLKNVTYLQMNTADAWESEVARHAPDIVIHAAWQIRELYGNHALTWRWNIDGSDKVFDYALNSPNTARLIYFSTVASYGAFAQNTVEHRFTELEPFRKSEYLYAEEKRIAEEHLRERYTKRANKDVAVAIVRPAAITGPRGRFMRIRFGLQATLAGQMKGSFLLRLVSALVSFVPVTPMWLRQFIHEDDVVDIVGRLAFGDGVTGYEAYNICPPGGVVRGADMAKAVGKRVLPVRPWMVRLPFFIFWHLTRGTIPTGRGAWRGYSYPIAVDGSKLTRLLGYRYNYSSFDAFYYTAGRYEAYVPDTNRRDKSA